MVAFAPAAFAKLNDGLTVEAARAAEDPEVGVVEGLVDETLVGCVGPRSVACREFVRDIECWGARSLVKSKRVVISRSFTDISTGLQRVKNVPEFVGMDLLCSTKRIRSWNIGG